MQTMVCIGDSLTEGADIPKGHTWPALVSNALGIEVNNCGICGDTTAGMLARFYREVVAEQPAFVFIVGGTNDLWWGWAVNIIVGNLFSMVFQARHHDITPVIGLPLPVHIQVARQNEFSPPWDGYERFEEEMGRLIETIDRHATESEVALIDLHQPFASGSGEARGDLFLPDGLHPNRAGHMTIAETVIAGFQRYFRWRV